MRSGVVFVGEDFDDADVHMCTGHWSAHWESDDGQRFSQGPEGVSAQEAIAWGRERADVVVDLLIAPCLVDAAGFECEFTVRAVTIGGARSVALDVSGRAIASGFDGLPDPVEIGWTAIVEDPEPAERPTGGSA